MKKTHALVALTVGATLTAGCVAPQNAVHPGHAAGMAVGYVVATPVLILKGLAEGIAATPHFVDADLAAMNEVMVRSRAPVDIGRTYRYAYGVDFGRVPAHGDTGQVFRHLAPATRHFQAALRGYGVRNADDYLLTAVRTADSEGYTLYAVVHRPQRSIRVRGSRWAHRAADAGGRCVLAAPRARRGWPAVWTWCWTGRPCRARRSRPRKARRCC